MGIVRLEAAGPDIYSQDNVSFQNRKIAEAILQRGIAKSVDALSKRVTSLAHLKSRAYCNARPLIREKLEVDIESTIGDCDRSCLLEPRGCDQFWTRKTSCEAMQTPNDCRGHRGIARNRQ